MSLLNYLRFKVDTLSSGDTTLIAAVADRRICIAGLAIMCAGPVEIIWKGGATDFSGNMPFGSNGGYVLPPQPSDEAPWFQTGKNEAFIINLSGAVQVSGHGIYYLQ